MVVHLILKDLLQAFKDKKGMALSFLLPIVLIALFSLIYGSFGGGGKDRAQTVIFCDEDSTATTMDLREELLAEKGLRLVYRNLEDGKKLVTNGDVASMLHIREGFEDSIANGGAAPMEFFYDESKEMGMGLTQGALMSTLMPFIGQAGGKEQVHGFIDEKYGNNMPEEMLKEIHADVDMQFSSGGGGNSVDTSTLKSTALSVKEDTPWGLIQSFAGTAVMMLLFSITGMGSALIKEREDGTLKRLLYSPIKPWQIMIGKLSSGFVFAMIQMIILVLFSWLAFQLDIFRNFGGLVLLVIAIAFAASGFGIFIASISKSQKQVESLSLIIILVMSALGGSMMPLFLFPEFLKNIAAFTINYWAIDGFYDVLGRDVGIVNQLLNVGILIAFGVGATIIAITLFTKRLKKDF